MPRHVVYAAEPLFGRRDPRLPADAAWLPAGPRTLVEHQLVELARVGAREVTVQTTDAARWAARPPAGPVAVFVQATRQTTPEQRLDELVCAHPGPLLVVEPTALVGAADLEAFVGRCTDEGAQVGMLRSRRRVLAVWLDAGGAPVAPGVLGRAQVTCVAEEAVGCASSEALHDALLGLASSEPPEGWREARPGVYLHPTARVADDVVQRCVGPVWFHAGCRVGEAVVVHGPAAIGAGAVLAPGVAVRRALVGPRTFVHPHVELDHGLAVGSACWSADRDHWDDLEPGPTAPVEAAATLVERAEQLVERITAATALVALSPLLGAAALAIRADDGGPFLYRGRRAVRPPRAAEGPGWRRHHTGRFVRYPVLRTMVPEADRARADLDAANDYGSGPYKKCADDPRVTRVGRWLRRASVDELPLLWEIVCGRLRLTGVWALPTDEARALADGGTLGDLAVTARLRFDGPAGLAGFWQARDRRSHDPVARVVHDAYQAVVLGPQSPFPPRQRVRRRLALAMETVLSALQLSGV